MARISGVDLPREKRIEIALTYIYGIGRKTASDIIAATGINPDTRVKDLTEEEIAILEGRTVNYRGKWITPEEMEEIREKRAKTIEDIFTSKDDKFILIIGPCSADNEDSVIDYISRLRKVQDKVEDKLLIVPRIYTNKPRTTGDGYYESCIVGIEGNQIEITV